MRVLLVLSLVSSVASVAVAVPTARRPPGPAARRAFVANLLRKMTLDEKVGQLVQYSAEMASTGASVRENYKDEILKGRVGSLLNAYGAKATRELQTLAVEGTRLKIPLLFGFDVVHGYRTLFPIPLGESSSWDLSLMEQTASAAAREASADGIHWTFAPMVDVSRDPRWGRVMEGAGEDPWFGAAVAAARVRGFQGADVGDGNHVLATAKHFVAYGAVRGGREYNSVEVSPRELAEIYLPPFEAAVRAGVSSVMTSFSDVNGIPSTADRWLLRDILRSRWGFGGVVVTDYTSIPELVRHGVAEDNRHAGQLAFNAGAEVDMLGGVYAATLARDIKEGRARVRDLDVAVSRVLDLKAKLGLFENPFRFCDEKKAADENMKPEHLRLARESARRSIVLLKNQNGVLPLKRAGVIAVIGPLADDKRNATGNWSAAGDFGKNVTLLEGIREATQGHATVGYARGSNVLEDQTLIDLLNVNQGAITKDPRPPRAMIDEAVALAKASDVVIVALGETFGMTGESGSRTRLRVPLNQEDLLLALHKTGKPIVLVLSNGRPLALEFEHDLSNAIVEGWFLGTQGGRAVADVLFGDYNPSGKLTMTFPRHEGQIPVHYAHRNTGRPFNPQDRWTSKYIDSGNDPLYPFGWGLSYSRFEYSDVKVDRPTVKFGQKVKVRVTVKNAGERAGEEVAQLYIHDVVASVTRPVKELRGFKKFKLEPDESRLVEFELATDDLKFVDAHLNRIAEPGRFRVMVGGNSSEVREAEFTLVR